MVRLIPAPKGTGIVAAGTPKKLLQLAGVEVCVHVYVCACMCVPVPVCVLMCVCLCVQDCYTAATGKTRTKGNFAKAVYAALTKTSTYLTPDMWKETEFTKDPYQAHTDFLAKGARKITKY